MIRVKVIFRELGRLKPEYSLDFDLPEAPLIGDYISVHRPDLQDLLSEDVVVKKRWWRVDHPNPATGPDGRTTPPGRLIELFLECERVTGPYSAQHWLDQATFARDHKGIDVEEMEVSRLNVLPR